MQTNTIFLVRSWDLCYEHDLDLALSNNLWLDVPSDLAQYVGKLQHNPAAISVKVRKPEKRELEFHTERHPDWHLFSEFAAVEFKFDWPKQVRTRIESDATKRGAKGEILREAVARRLASAGTSIAQRFIVLMNLAAPGFSSSRFAINTCEDVIFEEAGACHCWLEEFAEDQLLQPLSPIVDMPPTPFLEWGRRISGLWSGLPSTGLERSFCYFTHIFSSDFYRSPFETVVWAIGSLDAFYCDTAVGVSEKLKRRVPLIIHDIDVAVLSKAVNEIYADRSRTIHGDVKFVANFFDPYHETPHSDSHMNLFKSVPSLYYLLIRSLRYAAEAGTNCVTFDENVTTS